MFGDYLKAIAVLKDVEASVKANTYSQSAANLKGAAVVQCIDALQKAWDEEEAAFNLHYSPPRKEEGCKLCGKKATTFGEIAKDSEVRLCEECAFNVRKQHEMTEAGGGHDY